MAPSSRASPGAAAPPPGRARQRCGAAAARNIASVPCRCGHSWTSVPRRQVRHLREQGRASSSSTSVRRRSAASTTPTVSARCGEQVTYADHPARPHQPQRAVPAAPSAARPGVRRRPASRRQRASGRRRSAPSPVHGASSSTRSKAPAAHGGRVPSAVSTSTSACRADGLGRPAPRGAAAARRRSGGRRVRACERASRPALPPGPAHMSSQARSGPVQRRRASARATSWLPSSCTAARPSRTGGSRPGSPPCSRTANGDHGPGSPPDSSTSASRPIRPGHQVRLGRGVVGQQGRLELVLAAQCLAPRVHDPAGVVVARASRSPASPPRAASHCAVAAGGDLPEDGVDQTGAPVPRWPGRGRRSCRRRRAAAPGVRSAGRRPAGAGRAPAGRARSAAGTQTREDRVERALRPQRSVGQLGGEGGVPLLELPLAQQLREQQVGVRGARGDAVAARRRRSAGRRRAGAGAWPDADAVPASGLGSAAAHSPAHPLTELRTCTARPVGGGEHPLSGGCTSPSRTAPRPVPTRTPSGPTSSSPGATRSTSGIGSTGPIRSRSPRHVVQAPGAGVTPRTRRSITYAGSVQSTWASAPARSRRQADAFGRLGLGHERAGGDPVEGGHQQAGPADRQPAEQIAGGVARPDRLGDHAEDRPGVEAGLEQERRGSGDLVPGHDRVLDRRGTTPGREQ